MEIKRESIWLDYVRVIATFCVVLLHSAAPLLPKFDSLPVQNWWAGNFYESLTRVCVPLFFMVSGALLLGKSEAAGDFFRKRAAKVLLPLAAWSFIYLFWRVFYESSATFSFYSFYSMAVSPVYYHLWFLYAVIGLYLFIPLLRFIVLHAPGYYLRYYVALWFLAASIVPLVEWGTGLKSQVDLRSVSGMSGYLVAGFLLARQRTSKLMMVGALILFAACTCFTLFATYLLTVRSGGVFVGYFYGYLTPNLIIASVSFALIVKYAVEHNELFHRTLVVGWVKSLSSTSFGIYLIHAIYLYLLAEGDLGVKISGFEWVPAFSIPLTAVTVFVISHLSVLLLRNIPGVAKIVP